MDISNNQIELPGAGNQQQKKPTANTQHSSPQSPRPEQLLRHCRFGFCGGTASGASGFSDLGTNAKIRLDYREEVTAQENEKEDTKAGLTSSAFPMAFPPSSPIMLYRKLSSLSVVFSCSRKIAEVRLSYREGLR
jgi:hypothetical protein